jgi:hypothetical protein
LVQTYMTGLKAFTLLFTKQQNSPKVVVKFQSGYQMSSFQH